MPAEMKGYREQGGSELSMLSRQFRWYVQLVVSHRLRPAGTVACLLLIAAALNACGESNPTKHSKVQSAQAHSKTTDSHGGAYGSSGDSWGSGPEDPYANGSGDDSNYDGSDSWSGGSSYGDVGDEVTRYCEYGAVSQDQLDSCESHVTESDIDGYDTNAAMFARGDLSDCLDDAGPFCTPD